MVGNACTLYTSEFSTRFSDYEAEVWGVSSGNRERTTLAGKYSGFIWAERRFCVSPGRKETKWKRGTIVVSLENKIFPPRFGSTPLLYHFFSSGICLAETITELELIWRILKYYIRFRLSKRCSTLNDETQFQIAIEVFFRDFTCNKLLLSKSLLLFPGDAWRVITLRSELTFLQNFDVFVNYEKFVIFIAFFIKELLL